MPVDYNDYIQSQAWQQRVAAAKERANQRCQICNRAAPRVNLTVHHRTYERLGNELPADLTVLCGGCYDLYTKNRRIPSPPVAQPSPKPTPSRPLPLRGGGTTRPAQSQPQSSFTPATEDHQHAKLQAYRTQLQLSADVAPFYQLAADHSTPQAVETDNLVATAGAQAAPARHRQPPRQPALSYRRLRRLALGIGLIALLGLFLFLQFTENWQTLSVHPFPTTAVATRPLSPTQLSIQPTSAQEALATALPTPVPTELPAASTMTPTVLPTLAATAVATAASSPTAPPTSTLVAMNRMTGVLKQSALVCGRPCSCAPIVRTIASGTAVTVLDTRPCDGLLWYQIGEQEWLGPRLLVLDQP
ncbi:MAG: hypothetical protein KF832_08450 [Caldilineaceae bacterium]|nr:hypothetical protein [Caldilineaceae bacterium]